MTTLTQNVHELTRPHLPAGATLNTEPVPALLEQIEKATRPDRSGGASAGSDEPKVPVDVGAISLLQDISTAARQDHYELFGHDTAPLAALIQAFAAVEYPEWVAYLERITGEWCADITGYLNPTKPRRRLNLPCPSCGVHLHGADRKVALTLNCWGDDETMLHPSAWDANCAACGAAWEGEELRWLSSALAA